MTDSFVQMMDNLESRLGDIIKDKINEKVRILNGQAKYGSNLKP